MEKFYVLAGDFIFIESRTGEKEQVSINRIDDIFLIEKSNLDDFCENLLNNYESYLIPELYNGTILISN